MKLLVTAVVIFSFLLAGKALCEVIIVGEDPAAEVPRYAPGSRVPDNYTFQIGDCTTLIVLYHNHPVRLHGPYTGPLQTYEDAGENCAHEYLGERQSAYERYFQTICEKNKDCGDVCRAIYRQVPHKDKMTLKCD